MFFSKSKGVSWVLASVAVLVLTLSVRPALAAQSPDEIITNTVAELRDSLQQRQGEHVSAMMRAAEKLWRVEGRFGARWYQRSVEFLADEYAMVMGENCEPGPGLKQDVEPAIVMLTADTAVPADTRRMVEMQVALAACLAHHADGAERVAKWFVM